MGSTDSVVPFFPGDLTRRWTRRHPGRSDSLFWWENPEEYPYYGNWQMRMVDDIGTAGGVVVDYDEDGRMIHWLEPNWADHVLSLLFYKILVRAWSGTKSFFSRSSNAFGGDVFTLRTLKATVTLLPICSVTSPYMGVA